jgi:hypothetical protein
MKRRRKHSADAKPIETAQWNEAGWIVQRKLHCRRREPEWTIGLNGVGGIRTKADIRD